MSTETSNGSNNANLIIYGHLVLFSVKWFGKWGKIQETSIKNDLTVLGWPAGQTGVL